MNTGYCSFIVKGHEINFKELEKNIKIKATKIFKEGEVESKIIGKNNFDLMRFDQKFTNEENPNDALIKLLELIVNLDTYLEKLKSEYDVHLKCFVQSDNAQINFKLSPEVMEKIAKLGIDLEVSVLSWGSQIN